MDPATWISLGAMLIAGLAVVLNIIKALRDKRAKDFRGSSEYIRAQTETKLGSIEAAERVIVMYSEALKQLQKEIHTQNQEIEELKREVEKLQHQNEELQRRIRELEG